MQGISEKSVNQNIKYIFVIIGIVVLVASYFLGFTKFYDKKKNIADEIDTLKVRYDDLSQKNSNRDKIVKKTEENNSLVEEEIKKYDGNISFESLIMDNVKIENDNSIKIITTSFNQNEDAYMFGQLPSTSGNGTVGGLDVAYKGISAMYSISAEGSYAQIKDVLIDIMNTTGKRKVPISLGFEFDATNSMVKLTASISEYAITGPDRKQSNVGIPEITHSTGNIFYNGMIAQ